MKVAHGKDLTGWRAKFVRRSAQVVHGFLWHCKLLRFVTEVRTLEGPLSAWQNSCMVALSVLFL